MCREVKNRHWAATLPSLIKNVHAKSKNPQTKIFAHIDPLLQIPIALLITMILVSSPKVDLRS